MEKNYELNSYINKKVIHFLKTKFFFLIIFILLAACSSVPKNTKNSSSWDFPNPKNERTFLTLEGFPYFLQIVFCDNVYQLWAPFWEVLGTIFDGFSHNLGR